MRHPGKYSIEKMTRRRKDPFFGKENVRHFRLVHRPLGEEPVKNISLSFEDLFEEYDPSGQKHFKGGEEDEDHGEEAEEDDEEIIDFYEEGENGDDTYNFGNEDDDELVDIDAELDQFAEDYIDIEEEEGIDRVKIKNEGEKVGEAAKYGILYDDRDYDYTRHLRLVGVTPGAVFIQAPGQKKILTNSKPRDFFFDENNEDHVFDNNIVNNDNNNDNGNIVNNDSNNNKDNVIGSKSNYEMAKQEYRE